MKKMVLFLVSVSIILTGCSVSSVGVEPIPYTSYANNLTKHRGVDSQQIDTPVVKNAVVRYSKKMNKSIKDYYSKYTYAVINQRVYSGVDINHPSPLADYTIIVDTNGKMTQLTYKEGSKVKFETLHDYNKGITYIRKGKKWVEKDGTYIILDWDLNSFDSIYDVYCYLLGDNRLKVGIEGTSENNIYTFTSTLENVDDKALSGVDFDSLDRQTNLFVIKKINNHYIPITNLVDIEYSKDGYNYYCRTSFEFSKLSKVGEISLCTK